MASQSYQASNEKKHLRLISQVPDEIVSSSILSRLTMKEVARTRLVSHDWNRFWNHISCLNFEKPMSMKKIHEAYDDNEHTIDTKVFDEERTSFVKWVDNILENHLGSSIDEFIVTFDLDNSYQSDIDKWVVWALSRHVKILKLRFDTATYERKLKSKQPRYVMRETLLEKYCAMKQKHILTSLCLSNVNVSTQVLKKILESCSSTLEKLCIERSKILTSITTPLESLKYLKVYHCRYVKIVDIFAPKLLSFECEADPLYVHPDLGLERIHIESASSLTHVSIEVCREDRLIDTFGCLSNYFSQLEYLKLKWYTFPDINVVVHENHPVLANLKHLELGITGDGPQPCGWIPLIVASPNLEKLTLQLYCWEPDSEVENNVVNWDEHPLGCLKTLEIVDFIECYTVVDIITYVLRNGVVLKEVIFRSRPFDGIPNFIIPFGVSMLMRTRMNVKVICL